MDCAALKTKMMINVNRSLIDMMTDVKKEAEQ